MNRRMERPSLDLLLCFPPDHFRTVESFELPHAPTETPVEIGLKDAFRSRLSFRTPWDGKLYGYARWTPAFRRLCELLGVEAKGICKIYLEDWDDRFMFLMMEDREESKEHGFCVAPDDVMQLLEDCCRIEEQRRPRSVKTV